MILGIVGSEAAKFTPTSERKAKEMIRNLIVEKGATTIISGGCHLGGIDIWAIEIGREMGLLVKECLPAQRSWSGGYKNRNIKIAELADEVVCITVAALPANYTGMCFRFCYHCGKTDPPHVKSGGCWTSRYARSIGKPGYTLVVPTDVE